MGEIISIYNDYYTEYEERYNRYEVTYKDASGEKHMVTYTHTCYIEDDFPQYTEDEIWDFME